MLFYLASPLSNSKVNEKIANILLEIGCECFLPQRDAASLCSGKSIAESNMSAIRKADVVLAICKGLGNDTSWEIGYATAHAKPTILLCESKDRRKLSLHKMIFHTVSEIVCIPSFWGIDDGLYKTMREIISKYKSP